MARHCDFNLCAGRGEITSLYATERDKDVPAVAAFLAAYKVNNKNNRKCNLHIPQRITYEYM